jgi:hypothetical protein
MHEAGESEKAAQLSCAEAPSTKFQAPEKPQTSNTKADPVTHGFDWNLELGISLELGAWNLELPAPAGGLGALSFDGLA